MLIWISLILIVIITTFVGYYTYQHRKRLSCMAGMMIAMTNSMMSGIAIGTIVGIMFEVELSTPTMIAVVFGMIVGYFTGKPISLMAALDGLGAGIMGGMMGAMLGVMLLPSKINITILFVLAIFVIVMIVLVKVIDEEIAARVKKNTENEFKKPIILNPAFLIVIIVILSFSVLSTDFVFSTNNNNDFSVPPSFYNGDSQQAVINVEMFSFKPNHLVIPYGEPLVLNFKAREDLISCAKYIYSNDLGFRVMVTPGNDNFIDVGLLEPGRYDYACTMNMYNGSITIN